MKNRLHVVIEGRVQGVGFRFSAAEVAQRLGLRGWVRNVPDGSVEAEFEGPHDQLTQMLTWCRRGPAMADVAQVFETWHDTPTGYTRFDIR